MKSNYNIKKVEYLIRKEKFIKAESLLKRILGEDDDKEGGKDKGGKGKGKGGDDGNDDDDNDDGKKTPDSHMWLTKEQAEDTKIELDEAIKDELQKLEKEEESAGKEPLKKEDFEEPEWLNSDALEEVDEVEWLNSEDLKEVDEDDVYEGGPFIKRPTEEGVQELRDEILDYVLDEKPIPEKHKNALNVESLQSEVTRKLNEINMEILKDLDLFTKKAKRVVKKLPWEKARRIHAAAIDFTDMTGKIHPKLAKKFKELVEGELSYFELITVLYGLVENTDKFLLDLGFLPSEIDNKLINETKSLFKNTLDKTTKGLEDIIEKTYN
jgi:hypothetical protein